MNTQPLPGGGTILNVLRCALHISSGMIIFISRLSRSAERSKRYFHRRDRCRKRQVQTLPSSPSPSLLRKSTSPKGRGLGMAVQFPAQVQSARSRQRLPPRENWQSLRLCLRELNRPTQKAPARRVQGLWNSYLTCGLPAGSRSSSGGR